MGSNGKRDAVGQQIDAAAEVMDRVEDESDRLGITDGELLHMVLMTWIDRKVDHGLVRREDPRVEDVTKALAGMSAEVAFRREVADA